MLCAPIDEAVVRIPDTIAIPVSIETPKSGPAHLLRLTFNTVFPYRKRMGVSQRTKLYKISFCSVTSIALLPKLFTWRIARNNEAKQILTMIPFSVPCTLDTRPEYIISNYLLNFHRLFSSVVHPNIIEQCHALQNGLQGFKQHFHSLAEIGQQIKTIDVTTNHNSNEATFNTITKKLQGI